MEDHDSTEINELDPSSDFEEIFELDVCSLSDEPSDMTVRPHLSIPYRYLHLHVGTIDIISQASLINTRSIN